MKKLTMFLYVILSIVIMYPLLTAQEKEAAKKEKIKTYLEMAGKYDLYLGGRFVPVYFSLKSGEEILYFEATDSHSEKMTPDKKEDLAFFTFGLGGEEFFIKFSKNKKGEIDGFEATLLSGGNIFEAVKNREYENCIWYDDSFRKSSRNVNEKIFYELVRRL